MLLVHAGCFLHLLLGYLVLVHVQVAHFLYMLALGPPSRFSLRNSVESSEEIGILKKLKFLHLIILNYEGIHVSSLDSTKFYDYSHFSSLIFNSLPSPFSFTCVLHYVQISDQLPFHPLETTTCFYF